MKRLTLIFFISLNFWACSDLRIKNNYQAKGPKKVGYSRIYIQVDPSPNKKVGIKKNGYAMEVADVLLEIPQSDWLRNALNEEFKANGFEVVDRPNETVPILKVSINQLFVEPQMGLWAKLFAVCDLTVRLQLPSKVIYRRNFVELEETSELYCSENDYVNNFHGAVQKTLMDLVLKTSELLSNQRL